MIDLAALIELRDEPAWALAEYSSPLDDWTGLLNFSDVYESMNEAWGGVVYENSTQAHLGSRLQTDVVLQQLTEKFVSIDKLKYPPAFVVLPTNGATVIIGMVFNRDSGGQSYLCFPQKYTPLWRWWFDLQEEDIRSDTF